MFRATFVNQFTLGSFFRTRNMDKQLLYDLIKRFSCSLIWKTSNTSKKSKINNNKNLPYHFLSLQKIRSIASKLEKLFRKNCLCFFCWNSTTQDSFLAQNLGFWWWKSGNFRNFLNFRALKNLMDRFFVVVEKLWI